MYKKFLIGFVLIILVVGSLSGCVENSNSEEKTQSTYEDDEFFKYYTDMLLKNTGYVEKFDNTTDEDMKLMYVNIGLEHISDNLYMLFEFDLSLIAQGCREFAIDSLNSQYDGWTYLQYYYTKNLIIGENPTTYVETALNHFDNTTKYYTYFFDCWENV
jgi:hypothetical protein